MTEGSVLRRGPSEIKLAGKTNGNVQQGAHDVEEKLFTD